MQEYFKDNLIEYPLLSVVHSKKAGYSVRSKEAIPADTVVVSIPKSSILSVRTTSIADILEEEMLTGILALSLALIHERSCDTSPFKQYLDSIPAREDIPLFWSAAEVELLRGTDVFNSLEQDRQFLIDDYNDIILPILAKQPLIKPFSIQTWIESASIVSSRAFEVDEYHGESLVPFADLFNHVSNNEEDVHFQGLGEVCADCGESNCGCNEWEDVDEAGKDESAEVETMNDGDDDAIPEAISLIKIETESEEEEDMENDLLEMITVKDVAADVELFNTYGEHSNTALLRLYGFALRDNNFSYVRVDKEEILREYSECEEKLGFWEQVGRAVVEQVDNLDADEAQENLDDDEEMDGCDDEDCNGCGDSHSEQDVCGEQGCSDEDCQDCGEQGEEEEGSFENDFCFESDGKCSFMLLSYISILNLSLEKFEAIATDLDVYVSFLLDLRKRLENNRIEQEVTVLLRSIATERLTKYSNQSGDGSRSDYALIIRKQEQDILKLVGSVE